MPLALAIGAASHVLIDEFTHAGRAGATHVAVLAASYLSPLGGSWEGYRWAQYLLGAIGLAIVAGSAGEPLPTPLRPRPLPLARWLGWVAGVAGSTWRRSGSHLAGGLAIGSRALVFTSRSPAAWCRRGGHRDRGGRPHRPAGPGCLVHSGDSPAERRTPGRPTVQSMGSTAAWTLPRADQHRHPAAPGHQP